jgi:hypothetical protein
VGGGLLCFSSHEPPPLGCLRCSVLRHSTAAGSRRQTPPQVPCPLPPPRVPGPQADQPQYHRPESRIDPPPLPWATPPPGLQADQPQYHRLEAGQSLRAALVGKTLVEYPTIIVALPKEADTYPPVGQGGGRGLGRCIGCGCASMG